MDPETVKAVAQIVTKVVVPVAGAPVVANIINKLVGPSADHFGERIKRCFDRSEAMIADAGVSSQNAAPNIVIPLLQAAALAEHETIQEMFAALLANARIPSGNAVRPAFISIVSQLAPDEAVMFKALGPLTTEHHHRLLEPRMAPQPTKAKADEVMGQIMTQLNGLHLQGVVSSLPNVEDESGRERETRLDTCLLILSSLALLKYDEIPLMTPLGYSLLDACTPPQAKASQVA
jgi:hypothetical protein